MDRIIISDLRARCIIGINEDERREKQDVSITISIYADLRRAGQSDRYEDAVDYRSIKKQVLAAVENSKFYLLEALAEAVAGICLAPAGVSRVQVRVEKPSALRFAKSVGVEIVRERGR